MAKSPATAMITLYWDDRQKRWDVVGTRVGSRHVMRLTANATVDVDDDLMRIMLGRVVDAVEGVLW